SDRDRLFMERANVVRALFPGEYDVGARASGGWMFVRYAVAVQNGDPLGERAFPGRDPNAAKDVNGRVGVDGAIGESVAISGGVSGTYGRGLSKNTGATKPTFQWSDRNENGRLDSGELLVSPGVAATQATTFSRHALGLDAQLRVQLPRLGESMLYGELIW